MTNDKKWIQLNVGGTVFVTNRSTLTKSTPPNSPLHRISSNSTNVTFDRDESGAYLIDRDPAFFQSVLNYLRHGRLIMNKDLPEEGILLEAEYFNLPELIKLVKMRIQSRRQSSLRYQLQQQGNMVAAAATTQPINRQQQHEQQQQQHHHHHHLQQHHHGHHHHGQLHHQLAPALSPTPMATGSSNYSQTLGSLINQQEYLTNYVNGLLADDLSGAI